MSNAVSAAMTQAVCCFEAPSILTRMRAWRKWEEHCNDKGLNPLQAGSAEEVAAMCHSNNSATGPQSMWNCLDFLRRHLEAPFKMPARPGRQPVGGTIKEEIQGVVVEPEILLRMEAIAHMLKERNDWRLGALLGGCFIAGATTRFTHMQRSALIGRDKFFVHAYFYRGKQGHAAGRPAFKHACPRRPLSVCASLIDMFWDLWHDLCTRKGERVTYFILDHTSGNALTQATFHEAFREVAVMARATETPWLLTSKGLAKGP